jgi:hypothetical protein
VQYKAERRVDQMEGELEAMRTRVADLELDVKQKARLPAPKHKSPPPWLATDMAERKGGEEQGKQPVDVRKRAAARPNGGA